MPQSIIHDAEQADEEVSGLQLDLFTVTLIKII